jgi:hypothetical protein
MSVVHEGRKAHLVGPRVKARSLVRRLMIVCPETGHATDTGFELSAVPRVSARQQVLVDCLECGQDHEWRIEDSFLD